MYSTSMPRVAEQLLVEVLPGERVLTGSASRRQRGRAESTRSAPAAFGRDTSADGEIGVAIPRESQIGVDEAAVDRS